MIKELSFIALLGLMAGSSSADLIDEREQAVIVKKIEVNKVTASLDQYSNLKNNYYYGEQGLIKRHQIFLTDTAKWIRNWQQGMALVEVGNSGQIPDAMAEIESLIRKQNQLLLNLRAQSSQIIEISKKANDIVSDINTLSKDTLTEYVGLAASLLEYNSILGTNITDMSQLPAVIIARLEETNELSPKALRMKLKSHLADRGLPITEVLADFDDLILYEAEIEPQLIELNIIANSVDSFTLNFAWFQANQGLKHGLEVCSDIDEKVYQIGLSNDRRSKALSRAQVSCNAMTTVVGELGNIGLSKAEMVFEYGQMINLNFPSECVLTATAIDCEKLAILRSISLASLMEMNDDQLKFYELGWSELTEANGE